MNTLKTIGAAVIAVSVLTQSISVAVAQESYSASVMPASYSISAAAAYVPNASAVRSAESAKKIFRMEYARRLGISPTSAKFYAKMTLTRADRIAKTSKIPRTRYVNQALGDQARLTLGIKVATTPPVTAGSGTVTPPAVKPTTPPVVTPPSNGGPSSSVTPPSTTKVLTPDEQKSFQAMVGTDAWWNLSKEEKYKRLAALGISDRDDRAFLSKETFRFAAITKDIYPAFANGPRCEDKVTCDLASEWSSLEDRLVYKNTSFYEDINPNYVAAAKKNYSRMRGIPDGGVSNLTQAETKALFDKVGLTYTIQTKPFYDNGWAFTDLDKYLDSLGNGKPKQ